MKAVLISIQPKWCELIASGAKTLEVRKNKPKLEMPFKCYIYCTLPLQKVIGEFVCGKIEYLGNAATDKWEYLCGDKHEQHKRMVTEQACLTEDEMLAYGGHFGWHISDLVIYDRPKELSEFIKPCTMNLYCESCAMFSEFKGQCGNKALALKRPPQSWFYVEELCEEAEK